MLHGGGTLTAHLLRFQELDVLHQLTVAAVLAVGHQVDAQIAALLHGVRVLLVFICPSRRDPANHLPKSYMSNTPNNTCGDGRAVPVVPQVSNMLTSSAPMSLPYSSMIL